MKVPVMPAQYFRMIATGVCRESMDGFVSWQVSIKEARATSTTLALSHSVLMVFQLST